MAKPLTYTPPSIPDTAASDEVTDLVAALHQSGLMRALTGVIRAYPQLLKMGLERTDPDALRSVYALGGALKDLDPQMAQRLATGLLQARKDAEAAAAGAPEGPLALLKRLRDPNTRRGLTAGLAALAAIGRALR